MRSHYPSRLLLIATLALAPAIPADAARAKTAPAPKAREIPESEIVHLPQYTVTDVRILPPPESWRYATLPGFEILSDASNRTTLKFLKDFQQLQVAMSVVWPALFSAKPSVPTLLVLCSAGNSFRQFIPPDPEPDVFLTPTSLFVEDSERGAIVIDFMMQDVLGPDGITRIINDPYRQFYRQYTRFLMRRANNNKPFPPWLEEGFSRIFSTLDFSKKYIEFGRVDGGFGGGGGGSYSVGGASDFGSFFETNNFGRADMLGDPFYRDSFGSGGSFGGHTHRNLGFPTNRAPASRFGYIMPFEKMFDESQAKSRGGNWGGQCYAFVHMCLYGLGKKYQSGFIQFAKRALTGPVDENDFKQCFGRNYRQMAVTLRGYIDFSNYQYILFKAPRGTPGLPDPERVELREATQAEIGRIKGETLRLAGHFTESREALIAPYLRRDRDAGLLASLGLLESLEGHPERARKFLEAAARTGAVRPRAYVELARLRLAEELEKPQGRDGKLTASQVANVLQPLFTARAQPPQMAEVYSMIGYTWLQSSIAPKPGNLEVLIEGAARFPRNTEVTRQAAELYARHGDDAETTAALAKLAERAERRLLRLE